MPVIAPGKIIQAVDIRQIIKRIIYNIESTINKIKDTKFLNLDLQADIAVKELIIV